MVLHMCSKPHFLNTRSPAFALCAASYFFFARENSKIYFPKEWPCVAAPTSSLFHSLLPPPSERRAMKFGRENSKISAAIT